MANTQPTHSPAVRGARFAGTWYPGSASSLRHAIEDSLAHVQGQPVPGRPLALICPHSGHRFSYPVAAHAYALVRDLPIQRVVLLGPLHRPLRHSRMGEFMVPVESAYATPLGETAVDTRFIAELAQRVPLTTIQDDEEHSLEIELPFLQVVLKQFTLVPILMGAYIGDPGVTQRLDELARALAELSDAHTLFVASTDLSHMDDYADVVRTDRRTSQMVDAFDLPALTEALIREEVMACGATALVTVLRAAQMHGASGARVLSYMNSGDITGDKRPGNYTVGYMAAVAYG